MKRNLLLLCVGTAMFVSLAMPRCGCAASDAAYQQQQDVVYAEVHGTGLLMDVFTPTAVANGLAIIDVASGAWHSDRGKIRDHTMAGVYDTFCGHGYVVFAIRPGSKSRYTLSEMDQHVKLGIRYVKEHAKDYKIDPARIGLTGASAGGHLATLAALTPAAGNPDAKRVLERQDTSVQAVAVFFPPTDFLRWQDDTMAAASFLGPLLFLGGADGHTQEEIEQAARAVSPLYQVAERTVKVPFLLIHGDADPVVPLSQSQKLVAAIQAAGGSAELIVKPGGGHPWLTIPMEVKVMADWFDKQLGVAPGR